RAASSLPPADGRRAAEILGGLGAAGVAKAGATALVAGSLVVGVIEAPLPISQSHNATREKATLAPGKRSGAGPAALARSDNVAIPAGHAGPGAEDRSSDGQGTPPRSGRGSDRSGRRADDSSSRSGSDD